MQLEELRVSGCKAQTLNIVPKKEGRGWREFLHVVDVFGNLVVGKDGIGAPFFCSKYISAVCFTVFCLNPYPTNVENMLSSYQC